jgi:hypothetical protein
MGALDEMLTAWRARPDAELTLALCSYAGATRSTPLIAEIGATAEHVLANEAEVMLAVGRMYLGAGMYSDAQRALTAARRVDTTDPRPLRYLGEALLRQGEARRAVQVFAHVVEGGGSVDAQAWLERATCLVELETSSGPRAVAAQVARHLPRDLGQPSMVDIDADALESVHDDDAEELDSSALETFTDVAVAPYRSTDDSGERTRPDGLPYGLVQAMVRAAGRERDDEAAARLKKGTAPAPSPEPPFDEETTARIPVSAPVPPPAASRARVTTPYPAPKQAAAREERRTTPCPNATQAAENVARSMRAQAPRAAFVSLTPEARSSALMAARAAAKQAATPNDTALATEQRAQATPAQHPEAVYSPPSARVRAARPVAIHEDSIIVEEPVAKVPESPPPQSPRASRRSTNQELARTMRGGTSASPEAIALSQRGKAPAKRSWLLPLAAAVLLAGLGAVGGQFYLEHVDHGRESSSARAELDAVSEQLRRANLADLDGIQSRLDAVEKHGIDIERAVALQVKHRVVKSVGEREITVDLVNLVQRARANRVPEHELAAGIVLLPLANGDAPGALASAKQWLEAATQDPYLSLALGFVLELSGDQAAMDHYRRALALAPEQGVMLVAHSRLALLSGSADAAALLDRTRKANLGRVEQAGLLGLHRALDPVAASQAGSVDFPADNERSSLPPSVRFGLLLAETRAAIESGERTKASALLTDAFELAEAPLEVRAIARLALDAADLKLVLAAVERLEAWQVHDADATMLRARVAARRGEFAEAHALVNRLEQRGPLADLALQAAIVRAAAAYESLDAASLREVFDVLDASQAASPELSALASGAFMLFRSELPPLSSIDALLSSGAPWADLVAIDIAMAHGELRRAGELLARFRSDECPGFAVRAARLLRYRERRQAAAEAAEEIFVATPGRAALIERVLTLVDKRRASATRAALGDPRDGSDAAKVWLGALVAAVQHRPRSTQRLELPASAEALPVRLIAMRALVEARDGRARAYHSELEQAFPRHPEVRLASRKLR